MKRSTHFLGIFNFDVTKPKGVGSTWGSILNYVRAVGDFVDGLATERDQYMLCNIDLVSASQGYAAIFAAVRLYMSRTRTLSGTCLMC